MLKRRIALAALIAVAGVFASFFGGAARTLFYTVLMIPLFSLLYTLYVYIRFRIYQSAENKIIVKGEKTSYYFTLSDEDFIAYTDVKVEFLVDFSTPQNMELSRSYHLLPHEKIENRTEILCRYRGEYKIGVKYVVITDFLGLVRVKYPAPSTIIMSVLPKITHLEKINLTPLDSDAKLLRFSRSSSTEPPDCETRKYVEGDSIKLINWKLSAKKRELFVRQSSDVQNGSIVFVLDTSAINVDEYSRIITEDKIIESALCVADYLVRRNIPITILYEQGGIISERIGNPVALSAFYEKCAALKFHSSVSPDEICEQQPQLFMGGGFVIFAMSELTPQLCEVCDRILRLGGDVCVIHIGEKGAEHTEALDKRVIVRKAALDDEMPVILGGADEY